MRSQGRIRKAGGAVRFRPDTKSGGGGGGGAACRTMIHILVCARVRDSAWEVEREWGGGGGGGGRQLVPEGGISYEWGGGGGGGRPPPKPMLDPGLIRRSSYLM